MNEKTPLEFDVVVPGYIDDVKGALTQGYKWKFHQAAHDSDVEWFRLSEDILEAEQLDEGVLLLRGYVDRFFTEDDGKQWEVKKRDQLAVQFWLFRLSGAATRVEAVLYRLEWAQNCLDLLKSLKREYSEASTGIGAGEETHNSQSGFGAISAEGRPDVSTDDSESNDGAKERLHSSLHGKPGRPPLSGDELIYRLAKAQEGEELKSDHPDMGWKEIALAIEWKFGSSKAGVSQLRKARRLLKGYTEDDRQDILDKLAEFRANETNKTN